MILLPAPRQLHLTGEHLALPQSGHIHLISTATDLLPAGRVIQGAIQTHTGRRYSLVAAGPETGVVIDLMLSNQISHSQGYDIEITPNGIHITAAAPEAAFYAAQTLVQILRQHSDGQVPCLEIEDRPDFRTRGVMLDISRDKVPTMATLYALVDQLAELKINHLQLYTEHTFAYRAHPEVWRNASPMTGDEILALDQYCRERFIELVPNQNSFGHMERWLKLPAYRDLAETPDGFTFPWGVHHPGGFSLNPTEPRSIELIEGLYGELLPHFTSPLFNVGCDETFDLGLGKSKAECDRRGKGRVYLDFLLRIHDRLQDYQRIMMFWGDIILNHPELLEQMPRDVVALEWGYEAGHPFDDHLKKFNDAGIPVFVCPGTSSWCSFTGRADNALANLHEAAEAGIAHDAAGYLITDWGDYGHHQPLPVSYLGFAAGAAYCWSHQANRGLDLARALNLHVFHDRAGVMGRLAHDLGNLYKCAKKPLANGSRFFWTLLGGLDRRNLYDCVTAEEYHVAEEAVAPLLGRLDQSDMNRADASLIKEEFGIAAELLGHACRRGRFLLDPSQDRASLRAELARLRESYENVWRARNREGGLADSVGRLDLAARAYE